MQFDGISITVEADVADILPVDVLPGTNVMQLKNLQERNVSKNITQPGLIKLHSM